MLSLAPTASRESALLVASELVSNVVFHAQGPGVLQAWRHGGALRVEVTDHSPLGIPTPRPMSTSESHGRGLRLVEALSRAWGVRVDRGQSTKTVWADVPLDL